MAKQTVTLRLDAEDLTYLSRVEVAGAANFSEKIRALLAEARSQREGMRDYAAAHDFARALFGRVERAINASEVEAELRSEFIHRVLAWLPEVTAFVLSTAHAGLDRDDPRVRLVRFEQGLGDRVFGLVDSMLQLAQAEFPGCYQAESLAGRAAFAVKKPAGG